jgi:hypothetical protein
MIKSEKKVTWEVMSGCLPGIEGQNWHSILNGKNRLEANIITSKALINSQDIHVCKQGRARV